MKHKTRKVAEPQKTQYPETPPPKYDPEPPAEDFLFGLRYKKPDEYIHSKPKPGPENVITVERSDRYVF